MKAVYIHKVYIHLKINGIWKYAPEAAGRYIYLYGEVPENKVDKFTNKDTVFSEFTKIEGYAHVFTTHKIFGKKRSYIPITNGRIYEDELEEFEIQHIYEIVENPTIELLEKDLGFKGYSQLVFDREQELKNMLISES